MKAYDPFTSPAPQEWLSAPEVDRIALVEAFHERAGDFGESLRRHAAIHVIVENQLAMRQPAEVHEALSRLVRQGLDRHEAVHAIATILAEHLFPIVKASHSPPPFDEASYRAALRSASPASWRGED